MLNDNIIPAAKVGDEITLNNLVSGHDKHKAILKRKKGVHFVCGDYWEIECCGKIIPMSITHRHYSARKPKGD